MSWWKKGDEEEYIDITLGTLVDEDLNALEELGLTPEMHFHWEGGLKWFQRQYKDSKMGEWMKVKKADFTELVEEGKAFE